MEGFSIRLMHSGDAVTTLNCVFNVGFLMFTICVGFLLIANNCSVSDGFGISFIKDGFLEIAIRLTFSEGFFSKSQLSFGMRILDREELKKHFYRAWKTWDLIT